MEKTKEIVATFHISKFFFSLNALKTSVAMINLAVQDT